VELVIKTYIMLISSKMAALGTSTLAVGMA